MNVALLAAGFERMGIRPAGAGVVLGGRLPPGRVKPRPRASAA